MSLAPTSRAANLYWDLDSVVPGAGGEAPAGTWDAGGFVWNDAADGGVGNPTSWIAGSTAVFSAGTNASGTFTIDVQGPHAAAGLIFEEGIVTLNNTQIDLSGAQIDVSTGASAIINTSLTGASGLIVAVRMPETLAPGRMHQEPGRV